MRMQDRVSIFVQKIIDIILRSRTGNALNQCLDIQTPTFLTLDILTDSALLERWTVTLEVGSPTKTSPLPSGRKGFALSDDSDLILLVQSLYSHIRLLPLHSFSDMLGPIHFNINTLNGNLLSYSSLDLVNNSVPFHNKAKLKNYRFKPASTPTSTLHLSVMYDAHVAGLIPRDQLSLAPQRSSPLLKVNTVGFTTEQIINKQSSLVKIFGSPLSPETPPETKVKRQSSPFPSPRTQRRVLSLSHAKSGLGMSFLDSLGSKLHPNHLTLDTNSPTSEKSPESPSQDPGIPSLHIGSMDAIHDSNKSDLPTPPKHYICSPSPQNSYKSFSRYSNGDLTESVKHWSLAETSPTPATSFTFHEEILKTSINAHQHFFYGPPLPVSSEYIFVEQEFPTDQWGSSDSSKKLGLLGEPFGSLVGSYEESILNGRMSTLPSKPINFVAEIGVVSLGKCRPSLKCPTHLHVEFPAFFYELEQDESPATPYVGTVDLRQCMNKHLSAVPPEGKTKEYGYRIPSKGQLQIIIKNPSRTAIKLFLVPYDFGDMPANSKTFIRQKSYEQRQSNHATTPITAGLSRKSPSVQFKSSERLRYAIHVHFQCTSKNRIYLCKSIRVVFNHRSPDKEMTLRTVNEGPGNPKYIPLAQSRTNKIPPVYPTEPSDQIL